MGCLDGWQDIFCETCRVSEAENKFWQRVWNVCAMLESHYSLHFRDLQTPSVGSFCFEKEADFSALPSTGISALQRVTTKHS